MQSEEKAIKMLRNTLHWFPLELVKKDEKFATSEIEISVFDFHRGYLNRIGHDYAD